MFALDRQRRLLFCGDRAFDPTDRRWAEGVDPTQAVPVDAVLAMRWLQLESGAPLRTPIGVIGPNEASAAQAETAARVGALLGRMGLTLLCGGRQGVMEAACRGIAETGGLSIGLLPQGDPGQANRYVTVPIASGIGEARNAIIAQASACLIAIGDSHGTLSEVALGLRLGKTVFGLAGATAIDGVIQLTDPADLAAALASHLLGLDEPC